MSLVQSVKQLLMLKPLAGKFLKCRLITIQNKEKIMLKLCDKLTKASSILDLHDSRTNADLMREARAKITTQQQRNDELEAAIRYCSDYLNENKLNTIGSWSKAHNELKSALGE